MISFIVSSHSASMLLVSKTSLLWLFTGSEATNVQMYIIIYFSFSGEYNISEVDLPKYWYMYRHNTASNTSNRFWTHAVHLNPLLLTFQGRVTTWRVTMVARVHSTASGCAIVYPVGKVIHARQVNVADEFSIKKCSSVRSRHETIAIRTQLQDTCVSIPFMCHIILTRYFVDVPTDIDECASRPCLNSGHCEHGIGTYTCGCQNGTTGTNCETSEYQFHSI